MSQVETPGAARRVGTLVMNFLVGGQTTDGDRGLGGNPPYSQGRRAPPSVMSHRRVGRCRPYELLCWSLPLRARPRQSTSPRLNLWAARERK